MKIYHNPRCSKSRRTLEILQENGQSPEVVEYLKEPLTVEQLGHLQEMLGAESSNFVRTKESLWGELGLSGKSNQELLKAIAEHPILMERPIVVKGERAVIGRPPEKVLELI